MLPESSFYKHGKLLLTSEYFVLDDVPALAVPTKSGQRLKVANGMKPDDSRLSWVAFDVNQSIWFRTMLLPEDWARPWLLSGVEMQVQTKDAKARICQILHAAEQLNLGCSDRLVGHDITTHLEFDRHWGLGSSSTLIAAMAEWLEVNPYELLEATFGGSGYDLACADAAGPILYERKGTTPKITALGWRPDWVKDTHFVYRNQKQNSRDGIQAYRKAGATEVAKAEIGRITTALLQPTLHPRAAAQLLREHEEVVGKTLGLMPVQQELFPDFPGQLKSLGAWGGDFIWAVSEEPAEKVRAYFQARGFGTVIGYEDMVL